MARDLFINTDSGSIETAVVAGLNRPRQPVPMWTIVEGETQDINLYLVKSDGTYDSLSGSGAASVKVSITKPGAKPSSGSFTLTDASGAVTSALAYGASASAVEDALNGLNSGTGVAQLSNFATSDGVDDQLISADCSAAGAGDYYLTGKIRSSTILPKSSKIAPSDSPVFIILEIADVWQDFTSDTVVGVTPSSVYLTGGGTCDWSDVKLHRASDDVVVGHWKLDEQGSGSLDGVTAVDMSGNGYDGTHVGGTGGAGVLGDASLVDVKKQNDSFYSAVARTIGAMPTLTGTSIDLVPESTVTPSASVTGTATTRAQQVVEVRRQPAIYTSTWSTITRGFNGTLDASGALVAQSIQADQGQCFMLEVRVDNDQIARVPCRVVSSGML